ncbi:hypothetical protein AB0F88_09615 [Streptosporangium sp. NPDC023963]|uniref:hypothetical protein n=1 Tax=Streptosporangium sp. NPDC023963 TaxID=3155608 RepID=UPI00342BB31F
MDPEHEYLPPADLATWRVVPGDTNSDKHEDGTWAIVAGDGDEYDLYIEVGDAHRPKETAQFIIDAVTGHAQRLRLQRALAHIQQLRAQQTDDELIPADSRLPDVRKLAHLMSVVGDLAHEVGRVVPHSERAAHRERLYEHLAQVAVTTVAWMEATIDSSIPALPDLTTS